MSNVKFGQGPTAEQLRAELSRVQYRRRYMTTLRSTIYALIAVATVVLLAVIWLPVFRITGESMEPTLSSGDIVVTWRGDAPVQGEMVAFAHEGKTLVKRVVAVAGDEITMRLDGTVVVNGAALDEPYVAALDRGECDVELPMIVPDGCVFVMGDNRGDSVDSRSTAMGCIPVEEIIGRTLLRIWPMDRFEMYMSFEQLWRD